MKSKWIGLLAASVLLGVVVASLVTVKRAEGQQGWGAEGGIAYGAQPPRIYTTFAQLTNGGSVFGTNSPGAAPPGSLWIRFWGTNSWSNYVFNTTWTNAAGTNFYTGFGTGVIVFGSAITGADLRVSISTLSSTTSLWIPPQVTLATNGVIAIPTVQ